MDSNPLQNCIIISDGPAASDLDSWFMRTPSPQMLGDAPGESFASPW